MSSPFDVRNALAEISNFGHLQTNKFLVTTPLPETLQSTPYAGLLNTNGTIGMWAEGATLPGATLEMSPVKRYGYGPMELKPFSAQYGALNVTFRSDGRGIIHGFLHSWMQSVVNYNYNQTLVGSRRIGSATYNDSFEVNYKNDYVTSLCVSVFDNQGGATQGALGGGVQTLGGMTPAIQVFFRDCFPMSVGDVPLAWGARGDYMKFPVQFSYFGWYSARNITTGGVGLGGGQLGGAPGGPNGTPPGSVDIITDPNDPSGLGGIQGLPD